MHIKNKRGQSTVEYILLVTAVVAVMIVFATTQNGGFQGQLKSTVNTATSDMNSEASLLVDSHKAQPDSGKDTGVPTQYTVNIDPTSTSSSTSTP